MWTDPIVEETRRLRDEYSKRFDGDMAALFEEIRRRQSMPEHRSRPSFAKPDTTSTRSLTRDWLGPMINA